MTTHGPPVLPYAAIPTRREPTLRAFVGGTIVLAAAFFVAAVVIETQTSHYLLYTKQIFGPAPPGSLEEYRLQKKEFGSLIAEYVWAIPAAVAAFLSLLAVGPRRGFSLRWPTSLTLLVGAAAYSWVRWIPDVLHTAKLSEAADFGLAMALAATAGFATGYVRRRLNS